MCGCTKNNASFGGLNGNTPSQVWYPICKELIVCVCVHVYVGAYTCRNSLFDFNTEEIFASFTQGGISASALCNCAASACLFVLNLPLLPLTQFPTVDI